jgi:predicted N-acetyltransferase YhbS
VEVVELAEVTSEQWIQVVGSEPEPWGVIGEELAWRDKTRHVGARADDGTLVAIAGAVLADVAVADRERFPVVGIGGVFVAREHRGRGLVRRLMERVLEIAPRMGADRAMLFCRRELVGMYARFGFRELDARVTAGQPQGRIVMPMAAMWRPLHEGVTWPAGAVELDGLPF